MYPPAPDTPWSADNGADPKGRIPDKGHNVLVAVFPLTGPYRASGLASNVFRRNAAHNFGVHATPAVGITVKPSRLPAVPRPS